MGMPKSRKKKAEPAQANTDDASSSAAPQTTAGPAEAAAQGSSEPSEHECGRSSEDAPETKKRRVVMYVEPDEVAVVRKEIMQRPAPSGAFMQRVRDSQLEEQRFHAALCDNAWCDCGDRGVALLGQHDMFCQLHKCYAAEIGCCSGRDSLNMDMPCSCKGFLISYPGSQFQMCAEPNFREGRHIRAPWPDRRMRYWPTPQEPGRRVNQCSCDNGEAYGRYVPLCPYHAHGVSGKPRGEHAAERRGHAIVIDGDWFGIHLRPPPDCDAHELASFWKNRCEFVAGKWDKMHVRGGQKKYRL